MKAQTNSHSSVPTLGSRRTFALGIAALIGVCPAGLLVLSGMGSTTTCPDGNVLIVPGAPDACLHADEPPRGVDVRKPVSTGALKARPGAARRAFEAAATLGTASPPSPDGSLAAVPCDGDGVSGNRVQAMYVVEADRPSRFVDLRYNFKTWAAGVDDVVNRSAAVTGGVRNVRYVTEAGESGVCEAKVLEVTVPDGALDSFSETVNALRTLGFDRRDRKYLIWSDANSLCGVASMYYDDRDAIDNQNNGSFAQYARVDTACWGLGDAAGQHSTEAHELGHMLGGVQLSAPHTTKAGHCIDEKDALCYPDSASVTTIEVCSPASEYLLDCMGDDYFNTLPDQGSYLDTHWNAANSSFLINGGSVDPTASFSAVAGVNTPVIPGLSTQVSATPFLVSGHTLRRVEWAVNRSDCLLDEPESLQTALTCDAGATGAGSVQVRLVDSTGVTTTASADFAIDDSTGRHSTIELAVDDAAPDPQEVCKAQEVPVTMRVIDAATGQPVMGVPVTLDRRADTGAVKTTSATTGIDGRAIITDVLTEPGSYAARTEALGPFTASQSSQLSVTPVECVVPTTTHLTGDLDRSQVGYGQEVTISGTLTTTVAKVVQPLVQAEVTFTVAAGASVTTLGTAKTDADGRYTASVPLTASGPLTVFYAGDGDLPSASQNVGWVDAKTWHTVIGISVTKRGKTSTATGTLQRTIGGEWLAAPGRPVDVWYTPDGTTQRRLIGTGVTALDGTYSVAFPANSVESGTLIASAQPATGYIAATSSPVAVGGKKGR